MHYQEFLPSAPLSPLVRCYWQMRGRAGRDDGPPLRVLPDGSVDLLFNMRDPFQHAGSELEFGQSSYVVGAMSTATIVRPDGDLDLTGIRFRPGGAYPFLGFSLHDVTDRVVPVCDLPECSGFAIHERLAETGDPQARKGLIESMLLSRLSSVDRQGSTLARVLSQIDRSRGLAPVASLQTWAGIGTRQLERTFKTRTGLTPKSYCRVVRMRSALTRLKSQPSQGWAVLASHAGYCDQAHFIREFKDLTGLTPAAYARERADVAFVQSSVAPPE